MTLDIATLKVGDSLPAFTTAPVSRLNLALYCGASGDHNPIHVDLAFAQKAGMPDVFAHGMLSMAWLSKLLTNWVPQSQLRDYGVRFVAITQVGEAITCSGVVVELLEVGGERRVRVELQTANARGEVKLKGEAVVAIGGGV